MLAKATADMVGRRDWASREQQRSNQKEEERQRTCLLLTSFFLFLSLFSYHSDPAEVTVCTSPGTVMVLTQSKANKVDGDPAYDLEYARDFVRFHDACGVAQFVDSSLRRAFLLPSATLISPSF